MAANISRRDFIRSSVLATTAAALGSQSQAADPPAPAAKKYQLPTGKIGELQITRLILGGNLLTRYQHSRGMSYINKLVQTYNTDQKVRQTIELAEASGINTLSVNVTDAVMKVLCDHRKNGGKIQTILYSTADIENKDAYEKDVRQMVDFGSEAIYIWGCHADRYATSGKLDLLASRLNDIKLHDVPCGLGAHDLRVVREAEKAKLPFDFYIKTHHHHNYPGAPRPGEVKGATGEAPGYWCSNPEDTIACMKSVSKPWIAFKVMAAGAIPPGDAFGYAFQSGADFVLAGMFDFDIEEDCKITCEAVEKARTRPRAWYA
jgi:hypothetical protein